MAVFCENAADLEVNVDIFNKLYTWETELLIVNNILKKNIESF